VSDEAGKTILRNAWDGVPDPGPCPPLPEGDPPDPGIPGRAEYDESVRTYARWLRAARRSRLAKSLARLDSDLTTEQAVDEVRRAVRILAAMVLAGEVGPAPLTSLIDLF